MRRPVRLPGRQHQLQRRRPANRLLAVDDRRTCLGRDLRAGGRRLHAGVRRAAADQLRPLRDLHARHVRRVLLPRHHPRLHPQRQRLQQGHRADDPVPGHRDAVRDAGVGIGRGRTGVHRVPAAAKTQRPLADLPDHRDRHVVRAAGVRALHPAEAHQGLRRQQRPAADHPGAAQDSVHDLRRDGLQRHDRDHRRGDWSSRCSRTSRSTAPSSAAASARSRRIRRRRR